MSIAKQITKAREEKELSYIDFFMDLHKSNFKLSLPTLYRWENGKSIPNGEQIRKLAKFFKKSEQYFFE